MALDIRDVNTRFWVEYKYLREFGNHYSVFGESTEFTAHSTSEILEKLREILPENVVYIDLRPRHD